jgi:hypothetical protein
MYLQATTTAVWAPRGQTPVVRVHPSREMVHFYGTLDLVTGREIAMRSAEMNAHATAQHLEQILEAIPQGPLLLLWDRGPWHSGPPIGAVLAANPRLEIMRFPVAAPDLNPQVPRSPEGVIKSGWCPDSRSPPSDRWPATSAKPAWG